MPTRRSIAAAVAVATALSLLVACGPAQPPEAVQTVEVPVVETVEVPVVQTVEVPVETEGWCSGVTIRFFAGGAEGDAFASIVYKGAKQAESDLGPTVDYVWSGWNTETMLAQLRDAIAAKPDGIAFMGHAGDDAVLPLAAEANKAGILMMYQNVDVPQVRAKYSGGYVGAILEPQGRALGQEALRTLDLKSGDRAIVLGPWGQPGRFIREEAVAKALEDGGLIVDRINTPPEAAANPELILPDLTAAFLAHPETKLIVYSGGQLLGQTPLFMEALGKKPGEVYNIGFDTSPAVMTAFEQGYVQITSDQQPFLQGYMPILNLCLSKVYGLAPLFVDTGAGFVDTTNWQSVKDMANKGIR